MNQQQDKQKTDKSTKFLFFGSAGSMGFLGLAGACGGLCTTAALPLGTMLGAVGLGGLAVYLPMIKLPLFVASIVLSSFVIFKIMQRKNNVQTAVVALLLLGGTMLTASQIFKPDPCAKQTTMADIISNLSPSSQKVVREGIYPLWLQLGRAPFVSELQTHLGIANEETVLTALNEINAAGWEDTFDASKKEIIRLWPFSSSDEGIVVQLDGSKPVFARCAVDALGMSKMFGKSAHISVVTPLKKEKVEFDVADAGVSTKNQDAVVSYGNGCDDILFFASIEEFEEYKQSSRKPDLKHYTLQEALKRGNFFFGSIYGS
jgi:hypothetical protein